MPRSVNPRPQFFDSSGDPLISGLMYFYEPGTTTPKTTYSDVNLSTANSNPVVLGADGRLPSVFFDGSARQVLRKADGTLIWDVDPVGGANITGPLSEWSPDVTYSQYDIVITSDGKLWRSLIDANTDNAPASSPTAWEQLEFITIWNANVTYALNATVKASDGLFYKSNVAGNLNHDPTTDPVRWSAPVATLVTAWSALVTYADNALVQASDGYVYLSLVGSNLNNEPSVSPGQWGTPFEPVETLALPAGANQTGSFSAAANAKYVCNFTATPTILLPASATVGDIIYFAVAGGFGVILDPNGLKVNGSTATVNIGGDMQSFFITYTGATNGWV